MNSQPTFLFLTYLNVVNCSRIIKTCKPENFEWDNSLKPSFVNIRNLCSSFTDCECFLESNSSEILALSEATPDVSIDSGNFSVRGHLPLIRQGPSAHMHGPVVYVKEGLPFERDLSLENFADSYLCFWLAQLHSVSYFCSSIDHILHLYTRFLILFYLTYMRFYFIKQYVIFLVFGDFNVHPS